MQGLADGYFVLPYTIQNYLAADILTPRMPVTGPEFAEAENQINERLNKLMQIKGSQSVDHIHRKFGLQVMGPGGYGTKQGRSYQSNSGIQLRFVKNSGRM